MIRSFGPESEWVKKTLLLIGDHDSGGKDDEK